MPLPTRADIIMIDLGKVPEQVKGHEQANIRPCLVVQTLDLAQLAVVIPFTSKHHPSLNYSTVRLHAGTGGLMADSYALCHQVRSVSYQRFGKTIGILPARDFNKVLTVLADYLDL